MERCPNCGCTHIGTDAIYAQGIAMFCQECGAKGPFAALEQGPDWIPSGTAYTWAEEEAKALWNQWAEARKLNSLAGGYDAELRFSS